MRKLARKTIEAVQNTMLDKLVLQLFPILWLISMWPRIADPDVPTLEWVLGSAFLVLGVGLFLGWIAEDRPRPKRLSAYDHAHPSSPDAFSGWADLPNDQLRPPRFMRTIIMTASAGEGPEWPRFLSLLVTLSCFALAWMLAYQPADFWFGLHPWLGEQSSRELVFLVASGVIAVGVVRLWAISQRLRLAPETRETRAPSPLIEALFFGTVLAFFAGLIAAMLHLAPIYFLIGGMIIFAVTIIAPMRTFLSGVLFGRPNPPAANEADQ